MINRYIVLGKYKEGYSYTSSYQLLLICKADCRRSALKRYKSINPFSKGMIKDYKIFQIKKGNYKPVIQDTMDGRTLLLSGRMCGITSVKKLVLITILARKLQDMVEEGKHGNM